jgi:hypothetical protein
MNFEILMYREGAQAPFRAGIWSASNVHTAVKRALTGYPMERGDRDVAGVGHDWVKLGVHEAILIKVRHI